MELKETNKKLSKSEMKTEKARTTSGPVPEPAAPELAQV